MRAFNGFLFVLAVVCVYCFIARLAYAGGPPREVIESVKVIKENQKVLEENREAHTLFMNAKQDNERRVLDIQSKGWDVNWHTLEPVPFQ